MAYLYLLLGIIAEVFGTSMLKASEGLSRILPVFGGVAGFGAALFFLALSFRTIPLNVAYATWSGVGTAGAALIGVLIWKEKLNMPSLVGIALIIAGIVVLNMGGTSHSSAYKI
ncbi:QacE family quaternary ammonium compound efflux SMR transporter [Salibacterium salarium]|uniref:QacE family quaternary ammonium compound efflux SMR transporter n=1 Tax=Salibacterium salarium TaxID=284579 RepID=A0A3R9P558_9BACI|nr:multidrug efflux SMR transporter [Salibacterium salarium]RSL33074.1 QacE family quaternary ammonium compound efflux SMR transporter [Salibacterium salarium]